VPFVAQRQPLWERWDQWLGIGEDRGRSRWKWWPARRTRTKDVFDAAEIGTRFRALCNDLSLATDRHYSSALTAQLQHRVLLAHQRLYAMRLRLGAAWWNYLAEDFPATVRRERRVIAASALLFVVPFIVVGIALQFEPNGVLYILSPGQTAEIEHMYDPAARLVGRPRDATGDAQALAFYIANNVRIDFQCFAGGLAFGVGTVFYLLWNGLILGAVAGYLTHLGYVDTFWGFVAGHSPFELTGAVLSGAAGLKIGGALLAPGRRSRRAAMRDAARVAVRLLYGAAALTFTAAFVESFWSPLRTIPVEVKYAVGALLWILLAAYFTGVGRTHERATT